MTDQKVRVGFSANTETLRIATTSLLALGPTQPPPPFQKAVEGLPQGVKFRISKWAKFSFQPRIPPHEVVFVKKDRSVFTLLSTTRSVFQRQKPQTWRQLHLSTEGWRFPSSLRASCIRLVESARCEADISWRDKLCVRMKWINIAKLLGVKFTAVDGKNTR